MKVIQDTPLKQVSGDRLCRENIVDLIVDSINDYVQKDHQCLVYKKGKDTVKMTVGIRRRTHEKVQYCITAMEV